MDNMTIEDMKEFKRNAIEILRRNSQYATAKATEKAFDTLIWFEETIEKFNSIPCTSFEPIPVEDWERLGYTHEEAKELSELSNCIL